MIDSAIAKNCETILDKSYPLRCIVEWARTNFGVDLKPADIAGVSAAEIENLIKETKVKLEDLKKFGKNSNYIRELSNLAFLQLEIEDYIESEKNLFICLNHFKNQRDRLGQAAVLGIMGTLYFKKKEYLKSSDYYKKAFEIYKALNQIEEQITCLKGIGNSFIKLERFDDASDIFLECSAICSDSDDI